MRLPWTLVEDDDVVETLAADGSGGTERPGPELYSVAQQPLGSGADARADLVENRRLRESGAMTDTRFLEMTESTVGPSPCVCINRVAWFFSMTITLDHRNVLTKTLALSRLEPQPKRSGTVGSRLEPVCTP